MHFHILANLNAPPLQSRPNMIAEGLCIISLAFAPQSEADIKKVSVDLPSSWRKMDRSWDRSAKTSGLIPGSNRVPTGFRPISNRNCDRNLQPRVGQIQGKQLPANMPKLQTTAQLLQNNGWTNQTPILSNTSRSIQMVAQTCHNSIFRSIILCNEIMWV
jgi:hypothetical protein